MPEVTDHEILVLSAHEQRSLLLAIGSEINDNVLELTTGRRCASRKGARDEALHLRALNTREREVVGNDQLSHCRVAHCLCYRPIRRRSSTRKIS